MFDEMFDEIFDFVYMYLLNLLFQSDVQIDLLKKQKIH